MMFRNGPCVIFLSKRGVLRWDGGTEKAPWFLGLGHGKGFTTDDYMGRLTVFFFSYLVFLLRISLTLWILALRGIDCSIPFLDNLSFFVVEFSFHQMFVDDVLQVQNSYCGTMAHIQITITHIQLNMITPR
jgi:hypothetical protein